MLLAAIVDARPGERILDVGAGNGAALLCAAARLAGCRFTGIEIDPAAAALARHNAAANGWSERVDIVTGDVAVLTAFAEAPFDHVLTNPPYWGSTGRTSPRADRAVARQEAHVALKDWIAFCASATRVSLSAVFPATREDELVGHLKRYFGLSVVLPLVATEDRSPKRILVQATRRDAVTARVERLAPLVLHAADGRYTAAAEDVLRHGRALSLAAAVPAP